MRFGKIIVSALFFLAVPAFALVVNGAEDPLVRGSLKGDFAREIMGNTANVIGGEVDDGGLKVADPRLIVVRIINGALLLVGAGFLAYMVYAGFLYMTARGDADQVKKAINILRRAIVGVALILLSYSISYFVGRLFARPSAGQGVSDGQTDVGAAVGRWWNN